MTQHTKAPWKYTRTLNGKETPEFVIKSSSEYLTVAHAYYEEANARLIAASPDLLEALEMYFSEMEIDDEGQRRMDLFEEAARIAINKAKGSSE